MSSAPRLWRSTCRFLSGSRGTAGIALIEFAITLPLVLTLFVIIWDLGNYFYTITELNHAVQAGAEYVVAHPSSWNSPTWPSDVRTVVQRATALQGLTVPNPQQFSGCPSNTGIAVAGGTCATGVIGNYATISAQFPFNPLIVTSGLLPASIFNSATTSLSASATVRFN
jgi:Flp pilus assembly protein TadG